MAAIKIVRKGTTTNKLTIAKDRIELKLTDQATAEGEKWLLSFSEKIVEEVSKSPSEFTLRGRFEWNPSRQRVTLGLGWGERAQKDVRYFYSDKMGMTLPPEDLQ